MSFNESGFEEEQEDEWNSEDDWGTQQTYDEDFQQTPGAEQDSDGSKMKLFGGVILLIVGFGASAMSQLHNMLGFIGNTDVWGPIDKSVAGIGAVIGIIGLIVLVLAFRNKGEDSPGATAREPMGQQGYGDEEFGEPYSPEGSSSEGRFDSQQPPAPEPQQPPERPPEKPPEPEEGFKSQEPDGRVFEEEEPNENEWVEEEAFEEEERYS